ncbi:CURVATURE THYLAKOID protein [Rhynchospora pubera]|uniref:CURVATURE THYLAKOID protein n=1 Tax=Rhynchospora pubera TaxID=906938 RepID=A0AAV8F9M3_9POAL|nr:CURVATURE THYLAKOID protein [Rhynchospora pubera]KAJ4787816.1 CURVATURE THYLAKOID protein [Rhynchospora pubera]KAJ4806554.1 CURVATURE THYLAKOID protein [Rhynchospora pubera]
MALSLGILPPPLMTFVKRPLVSRVAPKLLSPKYLGEKRNSLVVAKAVGNSSESSSGSLVKISLSSSEDWIALAGLGFAGIVAIWAASNLISSVDKLPLIPNVMEFIGILYSSWFVYRYLLFKPDREELATIIKNVISSITGQ